MRITIIVYDGFDELDVVGPYEVFKKAAEEGADLTVDLWSVHGTSRVTAGHGLRIEPDLQELDYRPDMILVPGGGWTAGAERGARAIAEDDEVVERLSRLQAERTTVLGVCTGGMVLASAGLLDGRPATTHAGALSDLQTFDVEIVDARVVDDGDVVTAGGVTAGIDLALHVVEREFGSQVARRVSERIEHEPRGSVYLSQADGDE